MKIIIALLLIVSSFTIFAADDKPINSLEDIPEVKEGLDILKNPNFPMTDKEVRSLFRRIDRLAPTMESAAEVPYKWILAPNPHYNMYEDALVLSKIADWSLAKKLKKSPEAFKKFKTDLSVIIAHEYGHALLNKNILNESPRIKDFFKTMDTLEKSEKEEAMPEELRMKINLLLAYHELFADTVALVHSKNPEATRSFLHRVFGKETMGNLYERQFLPKKTAAHQRAWGEEMMASQFAEVYSPYSLLWPQRSYIADLYLNKGMSGRNLLHLVFRTIVEDSKAWPEGAIENFDPTETNERFTKKLLELTETIKADTAKILEVKKSEKTMTCRDLF